MSGSCTSQWKSHLSVILDDIPDDFQVDSQDDTEDDNKMEALDYFHLLVNNFRLFNPLELDS